MALTNNNPPLPLNGSRFAYLRFDAIAGFLVFLIAMPLCLAIARASGFPPIAGIWTAVIGGILTSCISDAQLTIKGPAAGLIVIVAGSVSEFGKQFGAGLTEEQQVQLGYELTLGIGITAGVSQMILGLLKAGKLADFFPLTPVHGMLASIGLIIISKQIYEVIGVAAPKHADGDSYGPLELYSAFPDAIQKMNPAVASIGFVGLTIIFGLPLLSKKLPALKRVPSKLIVLIVAIFLGSYMVFDLGHEHTYLFPNRMVNGHLENGDYTIGPKFLVTIHHVLENPSSAFVLPDFRGIATSTGLRYLLLFSLIGSLESLLSAKAVELLDPWKRKTNFNRDLLAVGIANTIAAALGGLPMISEIVRSKANIDNGARTRGANAFHGVFLLAFVLLFPDLIHRIPLAALGAMLVYTGMRLANPSEFIKTYKVGREQFVIFVATIITTLATDLLIGIAVGIALELAIHFWNGATFKGIVCPNTEVLHEEGRTVVLGVKHTAMFTNWIGIKQTILANAENRAEVVVDLSQTRLVDHSVMEKLHDLEREFSETGKKLHLTGLDDHHPYSEHPLAARKLISH